jgi:hypothetical protein
MNLTNIIAFIKVVLADIESIADWQVLEQVVASSLAQPNPSLQAVLTAILANATTIFPEATTEAVAVLSVILGLMAQKKPALKGFYKTETKPGSYCDPTKVVINITI